MKGELSWRGRIQELLVEQRPLVKSRTRLFQKFKNLNFTVRFSFSNSFFKGRPYKTKSLSSKEAFERRKSRIESVFFCSVAGFHFSKSGLRGNFIFVSKNSIEFICQATFVLLRYMTVLNIKPCNQFTQKNKDVKDFHRFGLQ